MDSERRIPGESKLLLNGLRLEKSHHPLGGLTLICGRSEHQLGMPRQGRGKVESAQGHTPREVHLAPASAG